jgi:radical SAM superfamily enzyme YgiQ (UPF0313 family)
VPRRGDRRPRGVDVALTMLVVLVSPYPDITAFGLRTLSAHLRRAGHRTRLVFMPDPYGDDLLSGLQRYEDAALGDLAALCRDADLVGLTLMTNFFDGAVQVTARIKAAGVGAPVIWGGVHPTIRPEECLEHADIVCIGDGEEALLELVERLGAGAASATVRNLWFRTAQGIVKNPVRPLEPDLDVYPAPDYSLEDHHVLADGRLQPLTEALQRRFLEGGTVSRHLGRIGYQTMTGRGCPHRCAYCINDALKQLYEGQRYLRWRSTAHVIAELSWVREHLPYVGFVWISDDAFFARPPSSLEEFCREYKERIGLPFSCLASPVTVTEEKMALLVDAGLIYVQMGIQTGSARIQGLFNRAQMSNERVMNAIRVINRYKDRMVPPSFDFILDVPYETDRDVLDSLRLIARFPKPFKLQPFALVLYPGTKLHEMATRDGLIGDERREVYAKSYSMRKANFPNLLVALAKDGRFPGMLLRALVSPPVAAVLNSRPLRPFFRLLYGALRAVKRRRATGNATA